MVNLFFDPKTHKPLNLKSWQFHMCGSRYFRQGGGGGGGGPGQSDKKSYDSLFFFFVFFSPQLFFTEVKWLISKKSIIFQGSRGGPTFSRGGPTFSRGVQLFPGGVQLLVPYRNPYNLWFSRGGGGGLDPLSPPLDPHLFHYLQVFEIRTTRFVRNWYFPKICEQRRIRWVSPKSAG